GRVRARGAAAVRAGGSGAGMVAGGFGCGAGGSAASKAPPPEITAASPAAQVKPSGVNERRGRIAVPIFRNSRCTPAAEKDGCISVSRKQGSERAKSHETPAQPRETARIDTPWTPAYLSVGRRANLSGLFFPFFE